MITQELPPRQCFDLREADPGIIHFDVRTPEEFGAGHPRGSLNVPVFLPGAQGMSPNPAFLQTVQRLAPDPARRVILSCAMGGRSRRGCQLLEAAGYERLVNMAGGYGGARDPAGRVIEQGWVDAGLPISTGVKERGWETLRQGGAV